MFNIMMKTKYEKKRKEEGGKWEALEICMG